MKKIICPLCQHPASFKFQKGERKFFSCRFCQAQFIWPFPSVAELKNFYQGDYWKNKSFRGESALGYASYLAEKDSFLDYFGKVFRQIENFFPKPGRVLDIGCGPGFFLKVAKDKGWQIWGVDLSPKAVEKSRQFLGTKKIYNQPLEKVKFLSNYFDLVSIFQTIEHIEKPLNLLREVRRILKPAGFLIISTPNASGWQAKLMGKRWFSYRHPDHFWFFGEKSLKLLLLKAGFVKIKKIKDPPRVYELGWLVKLLPYYLKGNFWQKASLKIQKILGKGKKIKIPLPLDSLVLVAQKR